MLRTLVSIGLLLACLSPAYAQLRGHGGPVRDILCTPDGRYAISTGDDAKVRVWRLPLDVPASVPDYLGQ